MLYILLLYNYTKEVSVNGLFPFWFQWQNTWLNWGKFGFWHSFGKTQSEVMSHMSSNVSSHAIIPYTPLFSLKEEHHFVFSSIQFSMEPLYYEGHRESVLFLSVLVVLILLYCTEYCTHSEPSGRAAHTMSPVTRPSAPWSLTWNKHANQDHTLNTHNLLHSVRSLTVT